MQPGRFTELFFLDEATAFAAGHRPCALCRRADYDRFRALALGEPGADALDARLHAERLRGRASGRTRRRWPRSPTARSCCSTASRGSSGATSCALDTGGLRGARARGRGTAQLITPPSLVAVLGGGLERRRAAATHRTAD